MKRPLFPSLFVLAFLIIGLGGCDTSDSSDSSESQVIEADAEADSIPAVATATLKVQFRNKGSILRQDDKVIDRSPNTYPCLALRRVEEDFSLKPVGDNDFVELAAQHWGRVVGGNLGEVSLEGEGFGRGEWNMKMKYGAEAVDFDLEKGEPAKTLFLRSPITVAAALPPSAIRIAAGQEGLKISTEDGNAMDLALEGDSALLALAILNPWPKVAFGGLVRAEDEKVAFVLEEVCSSSTFGEGFVMSDVQNAMLDKQEKWKKWMGKEKGKRNSEIAFPKTLNRNELPEGMEVTAAVQEFLYWPGVLQVDLSDGEPAVKLGKTRVWVLWRPGSLELYSSSTPGSL